MTGPNSRTNTKARNDKIEPDASTEQRPFPKFSYCSNRVTESPIYNGNESLAFGIR